MGSCGDCWHERDSDDKTVCGRINPMHEVASKTARLGEPSANGERDSCSLRRIAVSCAPPCVE